MTSGDPGVTNGADRRWAILVCAVLAAVIDVVNSTSIMLEHLRATGTYSIFEPVTLETTSAIVVIIALFGLCRLFEMATPGEADLGRLARVHIPGSIAFSLFHILGMVALRELAFFAAGARYNFDFIPREFIYEYRKDLLSYCLIMAVFWITRQAMRSRRAPEIAADSPPEAAMAARLTFRDGSRVFLLPPESILWIGTAGNYIEVATLDGRKILARGPLQAVEAEATAQGFIRVHRTRLVNRLHIEEMEPKASGDFALRLSGGEIVPGSRRYRDQIKFGGTS